MRIDDVGRVVWWQRFFWTPEEEAPYGGRQLDCPMGDRKRTVHDVYCLEPQDPRRVRQGSDQELLNLYAAGPGRGSSSGCPIMGRGGR